MRGYVSKQIIIIDDDKLILKMAEDILSEAGYSVEVADSNIYSNHLIYGPRKPDLIVVDVMMPLMTGDSKVKALKRREKSSDIPVLLTSSLEEEKLKKLTDESGADGYVCKPFTQKSLLEAVRSHLN